MHIRNYIFMVLFRKRKLFVTHMTRSTCKNKHKNRMHL